MSTHSPGQGFGPRAIARGAGLLYMPIIIGGAFAHRRLAQVMSLFTPHTPDRTRVVSLRRADYPRSISSGHAASYIQPNSLHR